jgi:hypothetical protein
MKAKELEYTKYYISLTDDLKHDNVQFKLGINEFPEGDGIRIYTFDSIIVEIEIKKGTKIGTIILEPDEDVSLEGIISHTILSHKINIVKIENVDEITDVGLIEKLIDCNHYANIKMLNDSDKERILKIFVNKGLNYKFSPDVISNEMLERVCMSAIIKNSSAIKYIRNPTYEQYMKAIDINPFVIKYISNPTDEMCILAVKKNVLTLRYIINRSREVMDIVLNKFGYIVD